MLYTYRYHKIAMSQTRLSILFLESFCFCGVFLNLIALRVRDWSGILLETEAEAEARKDIAESPTAIAGTPRKKNYLIYLLVPNQVHLCQMYSNGPCLCLPSHHLQKSSCMKKVNMPMSRLKVYPQCGAR